MIYPLGGMSRVGFFLLLRAMAAKAHVEIARVYQKGEKGCEAAQLCLTPGEAQPNPV